MSRSNSSTILKATFHEKSGVSSLANILIEKKNTGKALSTGGTLRSFQFVEGDLKKLRQYWWQHAVLCLRMGGEDRLVRLSAMPAERGATGYIEFM